MTTVLIIDDEPGITQLLQTLLNDEGYEVLTAEDGQRGLAVLEQRKVDLILLDLMMPNMSGWDFLEALRTDGGDRRPTIAVLSAVFGDAAIERATGTYGARAYITKPFRIQELLDTLNGIVAGGPTDA